MYYVGDGTAIYWKLGRTQWKVRLPFERHKPETYL